MERLDPDPPETNSDSIFQTAGRHLRGAQGQEPSGDVRQGKSCITEHED